MQLSYSRIATARGCWKKYDFKYNQGLNPIVKPSALTLGKLIHEAFEKFYKGATDTECIQYISDEFDKAIGSAEMFDQEDLVIAKYTALGMWTYYPHKDLTEFEEIKSEYEFNVKVPGLRGVRYRGFIDGLNKKDGYWFIRECKTTGLSQRQFEGRASTSGQGTGYVWAAKQDKYDVKGIMFDAIKKPQLRKGRHETMDDFGRRILQDYKERPDFYFKRVWSYRNEEQLELFHSDLVAFVRDLRSKNRTQRWHRNQDQCWNFNAECPYLKICFTKTPDPLVMELMYEKGGDNNGRNNDQRNSGGGSGSVPSFNVIRPDTGCGEGTDQSSSGDGQATEGV